jgi:hypothetical protein
MSYSRFFTVFCAVKLNLSKNVYWLENYAKLLRTYIGTQHSALGSPCKQAKHGVSLLTKFSGKWTKRNQEFSQRNYRREQLTSGPEKPVTY